MQEVYLPLLADWYMAIETKTKQRPWQPLKVSQPFIFLLRLSMRIACWPPNKGSNWVPGVEFKVFSNYSQGSHLWLVLFVDLEPERANMAAKPSFFASRTKAC